MKYFLALFLFFTTSAYSSVHFNVAVGTDFNSSFDETFTETFDNVYFQSVGDDVTIDKVEVITKTGTCELLIEIEKPTLFKWGKRFSTPMWDCKHKDVVAVVLHIGTQIYTYSI